MQDIKISSHTIFTLLSLDFEKSTVVFISLPPQLLQLGGSGLQSGGKGLQLSSSIVFPEH